MQRECTKRLLMSFAGVLLMASLGFAQGMSPEEREVWSGEQRYWDFRTAGKIDEYMTLWHQDVTAWPRTLAKPGGKNDVRREVSNLLTNTRPGSYTVRLEPLSVHLNDDFAFVFYRAHASRLDAAGNRVETHGRIHHTWWHTQSGWQIIAGMGADDGNR